MFGPPSSEGTRMDTATFASLTNPRGISAQKKRPCNSALSDQRGIAVKSVLGKPQSNESELFSVKQRSVWPQPRE